MLQQLSIRNFALIENVQLQLEDGFTVITGETGSGKSILLGALKLILGERADYSVIRDENKKTIVEAQFLLQETHFLDFFQKNDLDFEKETIIRREIDAKGKSRAFINDSPVQLAVLKELTEQLININSQHHVLLLKNKNFQRLILDGIAQNKERLSQLEKCYSAIQKTTKEILSLEEKKAKQELAAEFNAFQLEELKKLTLEKLNYEEIKNAVERGTHFEEIKESYQLLEFTLNAENGVLALLNKIKQNNRSKDAAILVLLERIQSVVIELQDIADSAENDLSELSLEPAELHQNIQRLDAFYAACRKHNLSSQKELMDLFKKLSEEADESEQIAEKIAEKNKFLTTEKKRGEQLATAISSERKKTALIVEKQVTELLNQLKLEGATLKFAFSTKKLSENGTDEIELFFAPNKGIAPQVIEKAASGGELSRLMLVIQYLLSQSLKLPTVIFDEIDTGVSGEVAQKIGHHLRKMGENMQLIAITHLPQVAGKGNQHIVVQKENINNITTTMLRQLSEKERIEEIAKLMSGTTINEAALINAKTLMND